MFHGQNQLASIEKKQTRTSLEIPERGVIKDRFGCTLAHNIAKNSLALYYVELQSFPQAIWVKNCSGKKEKKYPRKEYIEKLCAFLSKELSIEFSFLKDVVYSQALLAPHTPCWIKHGLTSEEMARLQAVLAYWPGLHIEPVFYRSYPFGQTGCHVLGYVGKISQELYYKKREELYKLQTYIQKYEEGLHPFLPEGFTSFAQVKERLKELKEENYLLSDSAGKAGIEAKYEEDLRGVPGKTVYAVNSKGKVLQKLHASKEPIAGKEITLSLSIELQEFTQKLLAATELEYDATSGVEPWIKGGAIVVMDPKNGEILSLASYPFFDPSLLSNPQKTTKELHQAHRYMESPSYIADLWDGSLFLEKEVFSFAKNCYFTLEQPISWDFFLSTILQKTSAPYKLLHDVATIQELYTLQKEAELSPYFKKYSFTEKDKLLCLDLCDLALAGVEESPELLPYISFLSPSTYHHYRQLILTWKKNLKKEAFSLFHTTYFKEWREEHFSSFLSAYRKEERKNKKPSKPYLQILEKKEKELFEHFWEDYSSFLIRAWILQEEKMPEHFFQHNPTLASHFLQNFIHLSIELKEYYLKSLPLFKSFFQTLPDSLQTTYIKQAISFSHLHKPLRSTYPYLHRHNSPPLLQDLAASFYPKGGYHYLQSLAYQNAQAPGSIFKLITAYQALMEQTQKGNYPPKNPLTLVDNLQGDKSLSSPKQVLGYTLEGTPIHRQYKGGLLPRSSRSNMGKLDLLKAIEVSSNLYFSILALEALEKPHHLIDAASLFGMGSFTHIDLPGEVAGSLPLDLDVNRSGLYACAIGHHTLTSTPLQGAVFFSTLANGGKKIKPKIVVQKEAAQKRSGEGYGYTSALESLLDKIHIHFPLFVPKTYTADNAIEISPTEISSIPLPSSIANFLLEGMWLSIHGERGSIRPLLMRSSPSNPTAAQDYYSLANHLIAKTGTAQFLYKKTLDTESKPHIERNTCIGVLFYSKPIVNVKHLETPELAIFVFSRFRKGGREVAPLAAQIAQEWKRIQKKE